jgi:hypothetical protein
MAITVYNWQKDAGTLETSFESWVSAQGSTPRSLSIGTDITLTGSLELPATIDIVTMTNNAKFNGTGLTLTINKMSAAPRHRIFNTGLNVVFNSGAVSFIYPEWFGSGNGNISFGSGLITPQSRVYVDQGIAIGGNLAVGSGSLYASGSGVFVGNVHGAEPTVNTHLTTKLYVDNTSGVLEANKVPYSGATGDVNLGEYKLSVSNIQFDLTPSGITNTDGLLRWNSTDGTLDLGMSSGDITMQIGQEMFMKVRNITGSVINNGTPVYVSGRTGNRPNIYPAISNSEATSCVIGITTQDIDSPSDGYLTTFGYVRQIKTDYSGSGDWGNTWTAGDKLYISKTVSGQLTNISPDAPHHSDIVGTVELVGGAGIGAILVNIIHHKTLDELSDVNGTALTTSGQLLVWNQSSGYFDFNENISDYALKTYVNTASGTLNTYITNTSGQLDTRITTTSGDLSGHINLTTLAHGGIVPSSRNINTSVPISGSGNLGSDITLTLLYDSSLGLSGNYLQTRTVPWSGIQNTPTTLSGYGITDALSGVAWVMISGTPTTISGYGITDAYTKTEVDGISGILNTYITNTSGILNDQINSSVNSVIKLQGDWNAATNTPDLSGVTVSGYAYRVSVSGVTNLSGITEWAVGDLAVKTSGWMKIDNEDISALWGNIGGTLANQTDLQNALNLKADITYVDTASGSLVSKLTTINTTYPLTGGGQLSGNLTLSMPAASATTSGYLTSQDWNTFNNAAATSGTVTSVSVVSTNGLAGTVANASTTPAISLSITPTGILKSDGTTTSAATAGTDYMKGGVLTSGTILGDTQEFIDINRYGFLNQTETTLTFDGTSIVTLSGVSWSYYRAGIKYTISGAKTINLAPIVDNTKYYVYIDATDGTLSSSTTVWTLNDSKVPVCIVAWNSALNPKFLLQEERHSCLIDRRAHLYLHNTRGTQYVSGATISGYTITTTTDAACSYGISSSVIADEDIYNNLAEVVDSNGTNPSGYCIVYRSGVATWHWKYSDMPFSYVSSGYIQWDSAGTLTQGTGGAGGAIRYYNTYIVATNTSGDFRFIHVPGQNEYTSAASAYTEDFSVFNLTNFPKVEWVVLYQLTWQTGIAGLTNKGKVLLNRAPQRINVSATSVSITSPTLDHNGLTNIQGGTANEYYHLTSGNYTIASQAASSSQSGYLTSTDWSTFSNKASTTYVDTASGALNTSITSHTQLGITAHSGIVPDSRTISTTYPLQGGGTLASGLTLSMPAASATTSGYLTSEDWLMFSGAGSATVQSVSITPSSGIYGTVTNPTTTPAIALSLGDITPSKVNGNIITTGSGTLTLQSGYTLTVSGTSSISGNNSGDQDLSTYALKTYVDTASGSLTVKTRTINTTAPLAGGGDLSADRTLSMPAATASTSGYLTHTDWNTFNGKAAGTHNHGLGTSGYVPVYTSTSGYANSIINLSGSTAASGNFLKGNGTSITAAPIIFSDISGAQVSIVLYGTAAASTVNPSGYPTGTLYFQYTA